MACAPRGSVVIEKLAVPLAPSLTEPSWVGPSRKLTWPVGIPVALVTTAVKIAGLPISVVEAAEVRTVCVLVSCTAWLSGVEVLAE